MSNSTYDVAIVGGCGHVGLPLGIAFADAGLSTVLYDIDEHAVAVVNGGDLPFLEPGADTVLERVVAAGTLKATTDPTSLTVAENVVVVVGTPVDEHLNPDPNAVTESITDLIAHLHDGQLVVQR